MIDYKYRIFESQWGIVVDLYGEIYDRSAYKNLPQHTDVYYIGDSLAVLFEPQKLPDREYINIHSDDHAFIVEGIKRVADLIKKYSPYKNTLVVFTEAVFGICDFQPEGLTACAMQWAAKTFGFECPEIQVTFDKSANQYIFSFE